MGETEVAVPKRLGESGLVLVAAAPGFQSPPLVPGLLDRCVEGPEAADVRPGAAHARLELVALVAPRP